MKKVVLFLFLLSAFACKKENDIIPDFQLEQADQLTADEYDIYGVILENFSFPEVVVRQQTSTEISPKENHQLFFELEQTANMEETLYSKFADGNLNSYLLDEKIEIPAKGIKLISTKEYAYYFEREDLYKGWELFESQYPTSGRWYISLNKIGFNENKTQAMVGAESYWFRESPDGPTRKLGTLYYLEKKNNAWEVMASSPYRL
ncbi:hypothetical protein ACXYMU_16345 [Pontibacter sp. CAU 1760]